MDSPYRRNETKRNFQRFSRTSTHVKPGKFHSENRTFLVKKTFDKAYSKILVTEIIGTIKKFPKTQKNFRMLVNSRINHTKHNPKKDKTQ